METKPLKRHPALRPLSKEHHFSLLICWKIRRGLELNIAPERIGNYLINAWHQQISHHFDIEEEYVFPILGSENKLATDAISEHRAIKRLILNEPHTVKSLNRIEEKLESHIRMEERHLFPLIQSIATDEQMEYINLKHDHPISEMAWEDEFWNSKA
ncbi:MULTISPECIES: hemerythrin domain-containing protein [unclassified Sphingobacterium]|uniref:hemerythrin domain-containing protein n=1 Tax=unclassified Sphingobacterium TaxID=2609468 RepID=UPI0020C4D839|nr:MULTISPECIES: hemerythrin domain-containing protein [unclassified Sphingobacterium]